MNETFNPFNPTRYEHDRSPLIWVSEAARSLEKGKSAYVCGTRGSGKTSLLKSLDWKERLYNTTLRRQINDENWKFISAYFRIPDHVSQAIDHIDWQAVAPNAPSHETLGFHYFATLIEVVAAAQLIESIEQLRLKKCINITATNALKICNVVFNYLPRIEKASTDSALGLAELSQLLVNYYRTMNIRTVRGQIEAMLEDMPVTEPGRFLQELVDKIGALEEFQTKDTAGDFHFKICIDDCETLSRDQQRFLNTLVRQSEAPLFWVISYVGEDYEATSTVFKNQRLSDADRDVYRLDQGDETGFVRFCEAVSSLRIFYALPENDWNNMEEQPDKIFSTARVLGNFSINELVYKTTRTSVSSSFADFEKRAEEIKTLAMKSQTTEFRQIFNEKFPPFYQTYVIDAMIGNLESYLVNANGREIKALAAYIRRKQRGAFIAICQKYRISAIPYAGKRVIFGLSDFCIRDYLQIMGAIYERYADSPQKVSEFARKSNPIQLKLQRAAIMKASRTKYDGILENVDSHPLEISKLVDCLGKLVALLQRDVKTAERGSFVVDLKSVRAAFGMDERELREGVEELISSASYEGVIREFQIVRHGDSEDPNGTELHFRLHRRFAPYFGFSFRGPYENVHLNWRRLARIVAYAERIDANEWAADAYREVSVDEKSGQQELGL